MCVSAVFTQHVILTVMFQKQMCLFDQATLAEWDWNSTVNYGDLGIHQLEPDVLDAYLGNNKAV